MSKASDLLGLILDTANVPADDDPGFDGKGYTSLLVPEDNGPADESEDDAAFQGLRDAGLSPEEAQENVNFMRPLSNDELTILKEHPELEGITKVDDAEHQAWLAKKASQGNKAMDHAFEDAVYGDNNMANNEEKMERADTDSGWGFKSAFKKIGRGIKKSATTWNPAYRLTKKSFQMATKRFMPNRDAQKAKMVRSLYARLWFEHANWLAQQDRKAGLQLKSRADYEMVAKLWAKNEIAKQGLPTQLAVDTTAGDDVLGSWWNPLSWFGSQSQTVMINTADKRSAVGPDGQPAQAPEGMMDPNAPQPGAPAYDPSTDPSAAPADPSMYPQAAPSMYPPSDSQGEHHMQGWNHIRNLTGKPDVTDSLGAFATQILGDAPSSNLPAKPNPFVDPSASKMPAKDNPYADKVVKAITLKLKAGGPMSASDLGLLSSAAKEGNVNAQKLLVVLESRGVAQNTDTSGLDPWMYKLNPSYWFASSRKKQFIDAEKKEWVENAKLQKQLSKQREVLDAAERAEQASKAVAAAKEQSAATEAQLKEIESSLKGAMAGTFVGHEKIMKISSVVANALAKSGKKDAASKLYSKIQAGQALDKDELKEAGQIAKIIGRMRVVHGDIVDESEANVAVLHGAFIGACVMGGIGQAQVQTTKQQQFAEAIAQKLASGQELSTAERNGLAKVLQDQKRLHKFAASLVSGRAFVGCPERKTWTHGAFVGAMKTMSESDKKMLATIVKLAKLGNPRAQRGLAILKKSGEIMGGSSLGSWLSSTFHYATAPIWLPAKGITKVFAPKGGGKSSPEQQRIAMMKSAYQRKRAAEARAAAASAQSDAEQRAQQAIADAADAEADAADAEAAAKAAKTQTAEYQANPDTIPADSSTSGTFVGASDAELEALMKKASAPNSGVTPQQAKILAKAHEKSPTGTKIRAGANTYLKSQHPNPKIRVPAANAIKIMSAKAKKGDLQAQRDFNAVKAGSIAVKTQAKLTPKEHDALQAKWSKRFAQEEIKAQKKKEALAVREARKAKVIAFQKKYEAVAANKLAEGSRRKQLRQHAKVIKMATKGSPKAQAKAKAYIAKNVAASKRGDKKALANVQSMQLAKRVQDHVTTKREARNIRSATKMANRIRKGDKKATRQYLVLKDASDKGNPNAKRAIQRLELGGAIAATIATGVVVLPKLVSGPKQVKALKPGTLGYKRAQAQLAAVQKKIQAGTATQAEIGTAANLAMQMGKMDTAKFLASLNDQSLKAAKQQVETAQAKAAAGTGTREELTAGARVANQLGDNATAGVLSQKAASAPSSTEKLKQVGNTVAASQAGNPAAQAVLDKALEDAKAGNPDGIQTLGHVMAAKTVDAANKGEPISPTMADAINLQSRAKAGDPVAQETLANVSEAATQPNPAPEAVLAAAGAVGAAALGSALATRPQARKELMEKVNPPIPAGEKNAAEAEVAQYVAKANEGTITPQEGARGVELATRLGKPKLAAEISAKSPPCDEPWGADLSSLPDEPLLPISGARELIRESIRALTFTTRDPLANWREGVAGRSVGSTSPQSVPVTSSGRWSPFNLFMRSNKALLLAPLMPGIVPLAATATAAASIANLAKGSGQKQPKPDKTAAPAAAPATAPESPEEANTAGAFVGSEDFKDLIAEALRTKKMSKADFNKAVNASAGPDAPPFTKKALGEQTLQFLKSKNVTVGGTDAYTQAVRHANAQKARLALLAARHQSGGSFVGASDVELEKLMTQATTDEQLDRIMTNVVERDQTNAGIIEMLKILQRRADLKKRVAGRASDEVPSAKKLLKISDVADKARAGDPEARTVIRNLCTTAAASSGVGSTGGAFVGKSIDITAQEIQIAYGHETYGSEKFNESNLTAAAKNLIGKAIRNRSIPDIGMKQIADLSFPDPKKASENMRLSRLSAISQFLKSKKVSVYSPSEGTHDDWFTSGIPGGTFVGSTDEFKRLIVEAVKSKKMSKDDFNKAINTHVKAGASREEKTAAGEKVLKFLNAKGVKVG